MRTVRRYLYTQVIWAVLFIALGFLSLFAFIDLVDELQSVQTTGVLRYTVGDALLTTALLMPSRLYELLPICVLIGAVLVMARLARQSEFTILRTSGLGPRRALRSLLGLGIGFVVFTFCLGDYLAPAAEHAAQLLKAKRKGEISAGLSGTWLKEKQTYRSYAVQIGSMSPEGLMQKIRIYEFDNQGQMLSRTQAKTGRFGIDDAAWQLFQAQRIDFPSAEKKDSSLVQTSQQSMRWPTDLSQEMVSAAILKPERMRTIDLFRYIQHLEANGQSAQRYEIEFWRKVFYPLACLVMMVLALPFAYLHFRSDGIAGKVFGGVLIGISFFLINNVFGYMGNLQNWWPWLTAAAPSLVYSIGALAAFTWFVLRH